MCVFLILFLFFIYNFLTTHPTLFYILIKPDTVWFSSCSHFVTPCAKCVCVCFVGNGAKYVIAEIKGETVNNIIISYSEILVYNISPTYVICR